MREAVADPMLLGSVLAGDSWATWRVMLTAAMGEPLTAAETAVYLKFAGGKAPPAKRIDEALFLIGRRGGKDRATSVLATYLACLVDWRPVLSRGERGRVLVIGPDQRQAQVQKDYIAGVFESSPVLSPMLVSETADTLELSNGIAIEVRAANFRRLRGVTSVAVIATEAAFWFSDETSSNPDTEILNAVRPSLATTGGPLVVITTPYARRGEVWELYRQHYGRGDPETMVIQGTTCEFNPTLPAGVVERALERDPAAAGAEYLAQFRTDVSALLTEEAVAGCIDDGVHERPRVGGFKYEAFCDPSGGSADSMTLGIAHREGPASVLDVIREVRPPFDPETVVRDFADTLKAYGLVRVFGDRYGGEWVRSAFSKAGITYYHADRSKSEIYKDVLPQINAGTARLLDIPRLQNQLTALERRTGRGTGRDIIDHPPGGHDDVANAAAGALIAVGFADRYGKSDIKPSVPEGKYAVQARAVFPEAHARTGSRMRS